MGRAELSIRRGPKRLYERRRWMDIIHTFKEITEWHRQQEKEIYLVIIGIEKACGTIDKKTWCDTGDRKKFVKLIEHSKEWESSRSYKETIQR